MSEKHPYLPSIVTGAALTAATLAVAHNMDNDPVAQPDHGNNPAAVTQFNQSLHGPTTESLPENPGDLKVTVPTPTTYVGYDVKAGDTLSGIVHNKVEAGQISPKREQDVVGEM